MNDNLVGDACVSQYRAWPLLSSCGSLIKGGFYGNFLELLMTRMCFDCSGMENNL